MVQPINEKNFASDVNFIEQCISKLPPARDLVTFPVELTQALEKALGFIKLKARASLGSGLI